MRKLKLPLLLLALFGAGATAVSAVPNWEASLAGGAASGVELIAFEAPGCRYCTVFRRDVLTGYGASDAAKSAALRFVDLNDEAAGAFRLLRPISVVPTVVVIKGGTEIGRIDGYVGRENFYRLLETLLPHS